MQTMMRNDHFSKCRRHSYIGRICSVLVQTEQTPKLFCQLESISFPFIVPEVSLHAGPNFESGCPSPHGNWEEGVHMGTYMYSNCFYFLRTAGWELILNLHRRLQAYITPPIVWSSAKPVQKREQCPVSNGLAQVALPKEQAVAQLCYSESHFGSLTSFTAAQ